MSGDRKYGRTEDEWDRLTSAGTEFLIERARLEKVTSYTEMNATLARRTGLQPFDFERIDDRTAMGHLLRRIVKQTYPTTQVVISALVHYLDRNDAGPGFYTLAQEYGLLPKGASAPAKEAFWAGQVGAVHDYYRRSPF